MDALLLTINQAADALGIKRTYLYELVRDGKLRSVKLGRLTRIPATDLRSFAAKLGRPEMHQ